MLAAAGDTLVAELPPTRRLGRANCMQPKKLCRSAFARLPMPLPQPTQSGIAGVPVGRVC